MKDSAQCIYSLPKSFCSQTVIPVYIQISSDTVSIGRLCVIGEYLCLTQCLPCPRRSGTEVEQISCL